MKHRFETQYVPGGLKKHKSQKHLHVDIPELNTGFTACLKAPEGWGSCPIVTWVEDLKISSCHLVLGTARFPCEPYSMDGRESLSRTAG